MLRKVLLLVVLSGSAALGVASVGCQPPSETTREKGTIDSSGFALVHVHAAGDNHHWNAELTLRNAPVGTYALVFSPGDPNHRGWFSIPANDPAIHCAHARGRSCPFGDRGERIVSLTTVGPGGAGVLRAAFDVGAGGWFSVVRLEGGASSSTAASASSASTFELQIVSEALAKDEEPHRFQIDLVE